MDEYESDKNRIRELGKEADKAQEKLDDVVLQEVYDLNEEDITVVDEFLGVW